MLRAIRPNPWAQAATAALQGKARATYNHNIRSRNEADREI